MNRASTPFKAWIMWGIAALFFFSHYYARVSPSIILPTLMHDFQASALTISHLSAAFYLAYVASQIPLGIAIDRFGAKWPLVACIFLTAYATFLFASTALISQAILARALFGFSAAIAFAAAIKIANRWFSSHHLALAVGLTQALGMLGAVIGTRGMADLFEAFAWRDVFMGMSISFLILGMITAIFLKNAPSSQDLNQSQSYPTQNVKPKTLRTVFLSKNTWLNALFCGLLFAPTQVLGESWGASFLSTVHDLSATAAAGAVAAIFIGWTVGGPLSGLLADTWGRRPVMRLSALSGVILLILIQYLPISNPLMLSGLLFLYGLTNAGLVAAYTLAGEMHSVEHAGVAVAIANMFTNIIGILIIPAVGAYLDYLIQHHSHLSMAIGAQDYQQALVVLPFCSLLAFAITYVIKEVKS